MNMESVKNPHMKPGYIELYHFTVIIALISSCLLLKLYTAKAQFWQIILIVP